MTHRSYLSLVVWLLVTIAVIVILALYELDAYILWVSAFAEVGGMVAIWIEFRRDRSLSEASFVMQLNQTFITDDELSELEFRLEQYRRLGKPLGLSIEKKEYKSLLNYLDFQEGLAMLVEKKILTIEAIDKVFSDRFFLVMNNPEVQQLELLPDALSYQGCYTLYDKWYDYRKEKNLPIILEDYSLRKIMVKENGYFSL